MNDRSLFPNLAPTRSSRNLFDSINSEMIRLFNEFEGNSFPVQKNNDGNSILAVKMDCEETDQAIVLHVEVPGILKNDIKVELNGRMLTVTGERKTRNEGDDKNYHIVERESGSFMRRVNLDFEPNPNKITAETGDGVLTVTVPKPEESKISKREITVNQKNDK